MASPDCREGLEFLSQPYIGRLVIVGLGETGHLRLITGMGGRSEGSNNRFYQLLEDRNKHGLLVRTAVHDSSKQKGDPSTTLYTAHRHVRGVHVASNGEQTDGICYSMASGVPFSKIHELYETEGPDTDYTARITGVTFYENFWFQLGRVERDRDDHAKSVPKEWKTMIPNNRGVGFLITTYNGEGGTEPNYKDPLKVPLPGSLEDTMDLLWGTWTRNRSGLCGKEVEQNGSNRFTFATRSIFKNPGHPELD